jgi:DNA-binding NarL/FixJ family response regulator
MDESQPKVADDAKVSEKKNRNDEILELHKQGKSNVAIARQLGLGVGEVKLVIDLYKA